MKLFIDRDYFDAPKPPVVYLCNTAKKRIGELPVTNCKGSFKWNSYSDISFEISRTYVDMITGETKVHPLYDRVEAPRNVLVENYGYFSLQDIDDTSNDNDIKSVTAFSLEYAASNKYLTNWHINTGEVDSKEVLYNEEQYGIDYNTDMDSFYKLASGDFDPYESYYQQVYTDTDSYTYEQIQIKNASEYAELVKANSIEDSQPHEKLYMKKFPNVQFFNNNESKRGLSLLHLIFENIPEWKIGNVDQSLWRKERKFSEDRISVYDFIQNNLAETFGCVAVWDSLEGKVHFYEELEDDSDVDNETATQFETDVFISKDNLASEVKVSYSSDNIKTKLVVTGSDDIDIREVNLGRNEIMDLSFYHTEDWMEEDLFDAYNTYLNDLQEAQTGLDVDGIASDKYPMSYPDAMKGWVSANNRWSDLMNEVPAEGNVVLVGDKFKKLYCTFAPINTAYSKITIDNGTKYVEVKDLYLNETFSDPISTPMETDMYVVQGAFLIYSKTEQKFKVDMAWDSKKFALIKKLNQYHIDEDVEANKQDNILLKLKNTSSDVATVRIYDKKTLADAYDERLQYYTKDKHGKYSETNITFKDAADFDVKKAEFAEDDITLWTNDYYVQSIVIKASTGVSEEPDEYPIIDWIKGDLTAEKMDLNDYKVTYIGTMGAYFVLAKDETVPENLQDYGVRLLEEKHKTYTTIFQTQTEAMFSQEKAQCIVQDETPEGNYKKGTRWLDTNSNPVVLKEYNGDSWVIINANVSETDQTDYENYQRYIDNYEKLVTVQSALLVKEREAEYCLSGYSVPDRVIVLRPSDGSSLEENMYNVALTHFKGHTVARESLNANLPLYTFTTSFDPIVYGKNTKPYNPVEKYYIKNGTTEVYTPIEIADKNDFNSHNELYVVTSGHTYAVYLKGTTPYVAYANSQGVYQMIMEYIRDKTEISKFFTVDQWIRLSPFIKEDEFNDPNFLFTGYESEEERIKICQELMESADKELKRVCKPNLEFSMDMANILALPEFKSLFDQFQLGNFIRVGIRDGYIKRSRLLEVDINFDDLSDFSCTFGDLVAAKSEIDKHAELLSQAVTAGKQVAKSSGSWQKSVDKTNKLEQSIANGLQDITLSVGSASGQAISWDSTGMHFRKYRDGSTTEFEPEEMAIINNALVATNDSWRTSKSAFGKYTVNGETRWGSIAEYITSDIIEGKHISGGSLKIGGYDGSKGTFIVHEDGSVEILGPDQKSPIYATQDSVDLINTATQYHTSLAYTGTTIFTEPGQTCTITCKVFDYNTDITEKLPTGTVFKWNRASNVSDTEWNKNHTYTDINTITITNDDIEKNAQFYCECTFDETKIK